MSRIIVDSLKAPIDHTFHMMGQYLDVCPDNIWAETSGGWPVWQQFYHALTAIDFFLTPDDKEKLPCFTDAETASLRKVATVTIAKDQIREVLLKARAKVDEYAAGISDVNLNDKNSLIEARASLNFNVAATLSALASHMMYHLGSCDAALRNHSISGVF